MTRVNVSRNAGESEFGDEDGVVGWFDLDKAERFPEAIRFNGNNHVGVMSGLQTGYQELLLTAGRRWVCHTDATTEFNGPDTYEFITPRMALGWLIRCGDKDEEIASLFGPLDEESGPDSSIHTRED